MISRETACDGKRAYSSRKWARKARAATVTRDGKRLSIYRCMFCGAYHLGHLPDRVRSGEFSRQQYRSDARPATWEDYL